MKANELVDATEQRKQAIDSARPRSCCNVFPVTAPPKGSEQGSLVMVNGISMEITGDSQDLLFGLDANARKTAAEQGSGSLVDGVEIACINGAEVAHER